MQSPDAVSNDRFRLGIDPWPVWFTQLVDAGKVRFRVEIGRTERQKNGAVILAADQRLDADDGDWVVRDRDGGLSVISAL